ncbi:MAG: NAD-dependent epimerase/dehydratase family protein [Ruminococcus sp.]|nr:NAD-dependent epimerase/dehydratase family protein [Ruminococcus sp.]
MEILVTGGTTFVSKYVAQYFLEKGQKVTVLNRGTRKQDTIAMIKQPLLTGCDEDTVYRVLFLL